MKRLLAVLLVLAIVIIFGMLVSLIGCSKNEELSIEDGSISENISKKTDDNMEEKSVEVTSSLSVSIGSLKGPTSIGMIKMFEEKPSLGENTESNYEIVQSPDLMVSKLLSGEVDLAALPTNVAVQLYNKGTNYNLAAIIGYGVLYIVCQNEEIINWEDLIGKKIYVTSKGSTPDVVLRYLLEKNNVNPLNDVELDYSVNQVELSQLMISGRADISILPEPFVTMVLSKNNLTGIAFDIESEWKKVQNDFPLPMSCLVVNSIFAEQNSDVVNTFLSEYSDSIDWVSNNISEAAQLVEKYDIGMDSKTAEKAIPRCNINFTDSGTSKDMVDNYIQTLFEFSPEDIGGKIPDENFYY